MNIEEILDMLDELLDRAWNLPLSGGRCVIDAEKVREMVDDIRLNLPDEIKQAKAIVKDRTEILSSAKSEAEAIVRKAEERARVMIAQDEVMKQAQAKATEIVTQAQTKSKEIRQASQEFSDEVLRKAEESLAGWQKCVRPGRHSRALSVSLPSRTIPVPSRADYPQISRELSELLAALFCCLAGQRRRCASRHGA